MSPRLLAPILLGLLVLLPACRRPAAEAPPTEVAVLITPSDIVLAVQETVRTGPAISGSLVADRSATLRAEVAGAVVHLVAEPGQRVAAGAVLARIDDAARRDAVQSARSAVTAGELSAGLAARNAERAAALAAAGAMADREREQAEWARSSAEAQWADARARLARAEQDLARTVIRAPFAGIVSERPVNEGDVVQVGAPLFTVVDPRVLRLEGALPVSGLEGLRVGKSVALEVEGTGAAVAGRVSRVHPAVDPATRQIRVTVLVPNDSGRLVAGLFADGRVTTAERAGIVIPAAAVDRAGLRPWVSRVRLGQVERVEVVPGLLDEARERMEIARGLAAGDTVLLGGVRGLPAGTAVRVGNPSEQPAAAGRRAGS